MVKFLMLKRLTAKPEAKLTKTVLRALNYELFDTWYKISKDLTFGVYTSGTAEIVRSGVTVRWEAHMAYSIC